MKSERETLEKLEKMSTVQMSSQKQQEIWDNIEKEIDTMKPVRAKRHASVWGTSAAAVAAVAVLAGGIYTFTNHGGTSTQTHPGTTTATNRAGQTTQTSTVSIPAIKSMTVQDGSRAAKIWSPINLQQSKTTVTSLLNGATQTTVHMPKQSAGQFNANVAPSTLQIVGANGQQLSIYPAYYIAKGKIDQNGNQTYTTKYIQDTLAVRQNGHVTYVTDGKLYNWLMNAQWKTEFQLGGTQTNQQSDANTAQKSGTKAATQQDYQTLSVVTYSSTEMQKLRDISQQAGVKVYVPHKMGGPSGYYKPAAPQTADHVALLSFEDMSLYEASSWKSLIGSSYFTSSNQTPVVSQGGSYTLSGGEQGQWYTIHYSDGARTDLFVVKQGNTLIGIEPNSAKYTIPSLVQAVAETLQPIS